jgi:NTP pyrophosphatase (non-canonical NTP hydrolase)
MINEFDDYQQESIKFRLDAADSLEYTVLGLSSEAGEIAGKVKKYLRGDGPLNTNDLQKELGDVLWYCANLADIIGYNLSQVALNNLTKLQDRKDRKVLQGQGDNR